MIKEEQVFVQRQDSGKSPEGRQPSRLVKLRRQNEQNGKLGFSLRGGKHESTGSSVGVFVSHVERSSEADKKGLKVNGLCVDQATYDQVIGLIKRTPKAQEILLCVTNLGRIPFQEKSGDPIRWLQVVECDQKSGGDCVKVAPESSDSMESVDSGELAPDSPQHFRVGTGGSECAIHDKLCSSQTGDDSALSSALTLSNDDSSSSVTSGCSVSSISSHSLLSTSSLSSLDLRETRVRVPGGRVCSEPFGCGVVKGPDEWPGIFVQNIKPASLAERVGLEPGDQLVRADGHLLDEMAFEAAIQLIKRLQARQDVLVLHVKKGAALRHLASGRQQLQSNQSTSSSAKQTNADVGQANGMGFAVNGAAQDSAQKSDSQDDDLLSGERLIDFGDTQMTKQQVALSDQSKTEQPPDRSKRSESRMESAVSKVTVEMPQTRASVWPSDDRDDSWRRQKVDNRLRASKLQEEEVELGSEQQKEEEVELESEQQKEEIKIVRSQNCKLCKQSSRTSKFPPNQSSKSKPAPPVPRQRNQQPAGAKCSAGLHQVSSHNQAEQETGRTSRQACPPASRPSRMQRYLSVDNLRSPQLAPIDASSSATSSSSTSPRQPPVSYSRQQAIARRPRSSSVSRRRQVVELTSQAASVKQHVSTVVPQPPMMCRRSNSVLGFPTGGPCCGYQSDQPLVYLGGHKSTSQRPVLARLASGNSYAPGTCGCKPMSVSYVSRKRHACNTLATPMAPLHAGSRAKSMDKLNFALNLNSCGPQPNCQRHKLLSSIASSKPARIYQQRRPASMLQSQQVASMSFERRPQQVHCCSDLLPAAQQHHQRIRQQQPPIYHYAASSGIISGADSRLLTSTATCCTEAPRSRAPQPAMLVSHQMVTQQTAIATCLPAPDSFHGCACCLPAEQPEVPQLCCQQASLPSESESAKCVLKRNRRQLQASKPSVNPVGSASLQQDDTTTDSSGYLSSNGEQYRRTSHNQSGAPMLAKSGVRLPRPPPPPPPSVLSSGSLGACKRDTRQQRLSTFASSAAARSSRRDKLDDPPLSPVEDYPSPYRTPASSSSLSSAESSLETLPSAGAASCPNEAPPRPPPPPERDSEFEHKVSKMLERKETPADSSSERTDVSSLSAGEQLADDKSNRLCFVDELKMLAKRQQVTGGGANNMESATLIKIINASKTTGASPRKSCSCSAASQRQGCPPATCCKQSRPQSASQPSKSAGKLSEEENKRRQHELLMKEFKSAHSRMFNKRRQQQTNSGDLQANAAVLDNPQPCRPVDRKVIGSGNNNLSNGKLNVKMIAHTGALTSQRAAAN